MEARPTTRLLFDEDVSPHVARALFELGFRVYHVGGDDQPPKGTPDPGVLDHAMRCNQTVVSKNYDMIILCAERNVSVIWWDPRGREMPVDEQASLAFSGLRAWTAALAEASEPVCVQVLRTKFHVLPVAQAGATAAKRYRTSLRRKARRKPWKRLPRPEAPGQLATDSPPS